MKLTKTRFNWIIILSYFIFVVFRGIFTEAITPVDVVVSVTLLIAFSITHGSMQLRLKDIFIFFIFCFLISNLFENISVLTGFPFGKYHYSEILGPKFFHVPMIICLGYFSVGYLSWTLAQLLMGRFNYQLRGWDTVRVSLVASLIMVGWDLCLDSIGSTITNYWIWHEGGKYFGVPWTNFLGWYLVVYLYFQLFGFYLSSRFSSPVPEIPARNDYWFQAIILYGVIALKFPLLSIFGDNTLVIDNTGKYWYTGEIYKFLGWMSLFTMFPIIVLCSFKMIKRKSRYNRRLLDYIDY